MKTAIGLLLISATGLISNVAQAAYTEAQSGPVTVTQIYANEMGSPFVYFNAVINSACAAGDALYLYDITQSQPNEMRENNKMAILLAAEAQGKQVTLDYYYDPTLGNSWAACYIEGISIIN
jgi:hypothetical protein